MPNTYTWEFPTLQVYTQQANVQDVVYIVHWRLHAEDETQQYKVNAYGCDQIAPYVEGQEFTPFEELTKEQIQGWVEDVMGEEKINNLKAGLDKQIEDLKNPPIAYKTPPWVVPPEEIPAPTPAP